MINISLFQVSYGYQGHMRVYLDVFRDRDLIYEFVIAIYVTCVQLYSFNNPQWQEICLFEKIILFITNLT